MKTKLPKKKPRLTIVKGLTIKVYVPVTHHKKRGNPCRIYTEEEIKQLEKEMGIK